MNSTTISVIVFEKIAHTFSNKLNKSTKLNVSNYNHKLASDIKFESYNNGLIIKFDFKKLESAIALLTKKVVEHSLIQYLIQTQKTRN